MNAPFNARQNVRDPFAAFITDQESDDVTRAVAGAFGWPLERVQTGGLRSAVQSLAVSASPSVLLIDLSESADPFEDINGLAEVCEPGTMVIACGTQNDVRFYRELIANGIHDYLPKPFTEAQLGDAIQSAQAVATGGREREATPERPHMMSVVVGVRGGVGATTLAVSLSWLLSEQRALNTALLDLDVHFGTGALALDLEPGRGLTDAIENPSRIDGLFLERALVRAGEKLGVLSAEAPINQPLTGDGHAFYQLQDELRAGFEFTMIDLPRQMLVQHPTLMQGVGAAVVVTELTLAATRDTIRILSWMRSNAPNTKVVLVANKVPASGQEEISRKDFEASVERKVDLALPCDLKLSVQAAKLGKPMAEAAKGGKAALLLGQLADMLTGEEIATPAQGKPSMMAMFSKLGSLKVELPSKGAKAAKPAKAAK